MIVLSVVMRYTDNTIIIYVAQSARAAECTDCISAEK